MWWEAIEFSQASDGSARPGPIDMHLSLVLHAVLFSVPAPVKGGMGRVNDTGTKALLDKGRRALIALAFEANHLCVS